MTFLYDDAMLGSLLMRLGASNYIQYYKEYWCL